MRLVTKVLFDTIETIKQNQGKIDKLVIILDAEEKEAVVRKQEVLEKIEEKYVLAQLNFSVEIFVCNHCFETWLLGCEEIYSSEVEADSFFYEYYSHYNIAQNDPIAKYHFHYLHEMFRYQRIRYTKSKPDYVAKAGYLDGIRNRITRTEHLQSFNEFYDFIIKESSQ